MSIKYSIFSMRHPQKPEEAPKFYAKAQIREKVGLDRIATEIAYATSLTEGDVLNVLKALTKHTADHLADGDLVDLGDLGSFQFQLSSKGTETKEEFTHGHISGARIQFRSGNVFRKLKSNLKFEKVISLKAMAEAKKSE